MVNSNLNAFIQEKLKIGRISVFQGKYIVDRSQLSGIDIKDVLREFNLLTDYEAFTVEAQIVREKERQLSEKSLQMSIINDRINKMTSNIKKLTDQTTELNSMIEESLSERNNLANRLAKFPENKHFVTKLKEIDRDIAPFTEKIATLEGLIKENQQALKINEEMKKTLSDSIAKLY